MSGRKQIWEPTAVMSARGRLGVARGVFGDLLGDAGVGVFFGWVDRHVDVGFE